MTYRSKYIDKINSRRALQKATPVVLSKRVPVVSKTFDTIPTVSRARQRRATAMATALSASTQGPLSTWPIDEDGWHEDTYK